MENSRGNSLSNPVEFREIDFEEIEWRSEYRPTKLSWLPLLFTLGYAFDLIATSNKWWEFVLYGLLFLGSFPTRLKS